MAQKKKSNKTKDKSTSVLTKNKKSKIKIVFSRQRIILFLIIVAITLGFGFAFKAPIENIINKSPASQQGEVLDVSKIDQNGLIIHFIDVGQGDSIAIRFPDNKTMLVDAGTSSSKEKLVTYLKNSFFEQDEYVFDYLLLTHSDADHCGGMAYICQNFVINNIYRPYMYCTYPKNSPIYDETDGNSSGKNVCNTATYYNTIKAFNSELNKDGVNANIIWTDVTSCNSTYKIFGEGYSIDFYSPTKHYITKSAGTIENDFSPIMVLNYNNKKVMLTGDASITCEDEAMENYDLPDVDLLKVGHHGSRTSTGANFLNQIKPEIAVISVGEGNKYKHPTADCLNRLNNIGAEIYRTDKNGSVIANITSGETSELNIFVGEIYVAEGMYIYVEYLMLAVILISITFCFGIKI